MEKIIQEKVEQQNQEEQQDAFDYMLGTAKEQGQELSIQELKVGPGGAHTHAHPDTHTDTHTCVCPLCRRQQWSSSLLLTPPRRALPPRWFFSSSSTRRWWSGSGWSWRPRT